MQKGINYLKNHIIFIYAFLFIFILVQHALCYQRVADDIWFLDKSQMGILQFTYQRMQLWTSRNIIECTMLVLLNLNKWIWIILDSFMFVLIFHSIRMITQSIEKDDILLTLFIALIILLFPFSTFKEAGWYATTLNYVWPLALGLYSISYLVKVLTYQKIKGYQYILIVLASLYAINQEQMCALIVGFYVLFTLYFFIKHKKVPAFVFVILVLAILMLLYHGMCPGNKIRTAIEITNYFPTFKEFNLIDKCMLGILSTISTIALYPIYLVYIWYGMLYIVVRNHTNNRKEKFIIGFMTLISFIISISDNLFNRHINIKVQNIFNNYIFKLPHINYQDLHIYLAIFFFILVFCVSLYILKNNIGYKVTGLIFIILCAAFLERVILGFSPTVFASGERTFINTYFLIFIATFIGLNARKIENML